MGTGVGMPGGGGGVGGPGWGLSMDGVSEVTPSGVGDPGPHPAAAEALSELLPELPPAHPGCPAHPAPAQRGAEVTNMWPGLTNLPPADPGSHTGSTSPMHLSSSS